MNETYSCHYLSVHICMFINPAETKNKATFRLLSHALVCVEHLKSASVMFED